MLTDSSRVTRSAGSAAAADRQVLHIGSGSHGPAYCSRRARALPSASSASLLTVVVSQEPRLRTGSRSVAAWSRSHASCTQSSASASDPVLAYARRSSRGRCASNSTRQRGLACIIARVPVPPSVATSARLAAQSSNVCLPRTSGWADVSAPPRSARPSAPGSGSGTRTARRPVARRQVLARSATLATSGPAASGSGPRRGPLDRVPRPWRPLRRTGYRLNQYARGGARLRTRGRANMAARYSWNWVARTTVHGTPPRSTTFSWLGLHLEVTHRARVHNRAQKRRRDGPRPPAARRPAAAACRRQASPTRSATHCLLASTTTSHPTSALSRPTRW